MHLQDLKYLDTKEKFKQEIDKTDKSQEFLVDKAGNTLGFRIQRESGGILEYDADLRQWSHGNESVLDIRPEDGAMNLPPYKLGPGNEIQETCLYPDPSTMAAYRQISTVRELGEEKFKTALAMSMLTLSKDPTPTDLAKISILAARAVQMNLYSDLGFSLDEITASINDLTANGLEVDLIDKKRSYSPDDMEHALLHMGQKHFESLVSANAEETRNLSKSIHVFELKNSFEVLNTLVQLKREGKGSPTPLSEKISDATQRAQTTSSQNTHTQDGPCL